jgi:hypothetical protein
MRIAGDRIATQLLRAALLAGALALLGPAVAAPTGDGGGALAEARPASALPGGGGVGQVRRGAGGQIEAAGPAKSAGATGKGPCRAEAICVGPGLGHETLAAALAGARPGAIVEVAAGTYRESVLLKTAGLTVRGIGGRPHFDCAGIKLVGDKACFLLVAPDIALENLEISGAAVDEQVGANGACVRNDPGIGLTLRGIVCHGSQDGVLTSGGRIVIEDSEFYDNGWTGLTHNVYLSGDCTASVRRSTFRDARIGHELKSRCRETTIEDSVFHATRGSRALDLPDGGTTTITGGTIFQTAGVENPQIIGYAMESCRFPGSVTLRGTRIASSHPQAEIANSGKCPDAVIRLLGVTFEGRPPTLTGKVVVE